MVHTTRRIDRARIGLNPTRHAVDRPLDGRHSSLSVAMDAMLDASTSAEMSSTIDLVDLIDPRGVECLNALRDTDWTKALTRGERDVETLTLCTDDDEELIVRVEFVKNVRVRRVRVCGVKDEVKRADASAPKEIRVFVNAATPVSFENARRKKPTQTIDCEKDLDEDGFVDVDAASAFENVRTMTFFVSENVDGTTRTELARLEIRGAPADEADVRELKKS